MNPQQAMHSITPFFFASLYHNSNDQYLRLIHDAMQCRAMQRAPPPPLFQSCREGCLVIYPFILTCTHTHTKPKLPKWPRQNSYKRN